MNTVIWEASVTATKTERGSLAKRSMIINMENDLAASTYEMWQAELGLVKNYRAFDYVCYLVENYTYESFMKKRLGDLIEEIADNMHISKQAVLKNTNTYIRIVMSDSKCCIAVLINRFLGSAYMPTVKEFFAVVLLQKKLLESDIPDMPGHFPITQQ